MSVLGAGAPASFSSARVGLGAWLAEMALNTQSRRRKGVKGGVLVPLEKVCDGGRHFLFRFFDVFRECWPVEPVVGILDISQFI